MVRRPIEHPRCHWRDQENGGGSEAKQPVHGRQAMYAIDAITKGPVKGGWHASLSGVCLAPRARRAPSVAQVIDVAVARSRSSSEGIVRTLPICMHSPAERTRREAPAYAGCGLMRNGGFARRSTSSSPNTSARDGQTGTTSGRCFGNCARTSGVMLRVSITIRGGVCASQSDSETSA
jgi:hypothetical protein